MPAQRKISDYLARFREKRLSKPLCCRVCRRSGRLRWHGSYLRTLITMTQVFDQLPIQRVFCAFCRHAFALLPAFVEKYHHYAKDAIGHALRMLKSHTYETVAGMFVGRAERSIAILTIYLWRREYA